MEAIIQTYRVMLGVWNQPLCAKSNFGINRQKHDSHFDVF